MTLIGVCGSNDTFSGLADTFRRNDIFRIVSTVSLLSTAASVRLLGNETIAAASSDAVPEGLIDAIALQFKKRKYPKQVVKESIFEREGEPLNSACSIRCPPGTRQVSKNHQGITADVVGPNTHHIAESR